MPWAGNSKHVSGLPQFLQTCDGVTVPTSSTHVTLLAPASNISILGDPSIDCYINTRNTTCTTSNAKIPAGGAWAYPGATPIQQFTMIAPGGPARVEITSS